MDQESLYAWHDHNTAARRTSHPKLARMLVISYLCFLRRLLRMYLTSSTSIEQELVRDSTRGWIPHEKRYERDVLILAPKVSTY